MKKIISVLIAMSMLLLCACGTNTEKPTQPENVDVGVNAMKNYRMSQLEVEKVKGTVKRVIWRYENELILSCTEGGYENPHSRVYSLPLDASPKPFDKMYCIEEFDGPVMFDDRICGPDDDGDTVYQSNGTLYYLDSPKQFDADEVKGKMYFVSAGLAYYAEVTAGTALEFYSIREQMPVGIPLTDTLIHGCTWQNHEDCNVFAYNNDIDIKIISIDDPNESMVLKRGVDYMPPDGVVSLFESYYFGDGKVVQSFLCEDEAVLMLIDTAAKTQRVIARGSKIEYVQNGMKFLAYAQITSSEGHVKTALKKYDIERGTTVTVAEFDDVIIESFGVLYDGTNAAVVTAPDADGKQTIYMFELV